VHAWSGGGGPQYLPELESSDCGLGGGRGLLEKCGITKLRWSGTSVPGAGSTLLGPERTTGPPFVGVLLCVSRGDRSPALSLEREWWRFVWSLRIVQWTRASFVSVHICVVIS